MRLRLPGLTGRLGLRARITLAFAVGALLLSALLSATTWALTRENLVNQREDAASTIVYQNARIVRSRVTPEADLQQILSSLSTPFGSRPVLYRDQAYTSVTPAFGQDALPEELRAAVLAGQPARMRYEYRGEKQMAVGVPLPAIDAAYF
ncbi:MAG TPA: hypothetical protein VK007_11580, partial [Acidimicrobiales bacterium]|nr:hypothetical protein [Acidimicrobiales bacterium]